MDQAQVKRGRPVAAEYNLDKLGEKPPLSLPTQDRSGSAPPKSQVRPPHHLLSAF